MLCRFPDFGILGFCPYTWAKMPFFGKKRPIFFVGPKWSKMAKSGQKWPKLPQNRRNKSRGSPRKSQRIPKISEKWPKTLPQCNMKMHQKSKKSAKIGKNYKKNRFSLQQLPKKGHFLQEMHQKQKSPSAKKFKKTPLGPPTRGGGAIPICPSDDSAQRSLYRSLGGHHILFPLNSPSH